jgi:predicted dehydrogenase
MERIKIAQLGVTHEHANGKIATVRRMTDVFEVVGVYDDRPNPAPTHFNGMGPFEGCTFISEEELLNYPGLQGVLVETPNTDLVPRALKCMEVGLPMHMDKPGGEDLALFKKLLDGCEAKQLPFQMGYMFRGNPAMQHCRKLVEDGVLGNIFEIEMDMNHHYGGDSYQDYLGTFKGGIMFNLCCHLIDYIVAFMGAPEQITPFLQNTPDVAPEIKNNCLSILQYKNATVVLRACSKDGGYGRRLKINGTNGSIELTPIERFDNQPLHVKLWLVNEKPGFKKGQQTIEFPGRTDRYLEQMVEFAQMIRGEIENPYSYAHDYLTQKVLLAASGDVAWDDIKDK